jgi:hypothetical protein
LSRQSYFDEIGVFGPEGSRNGTSLMTFFLKHNKPNASEEAKKTKNKNNNK